MRARAFALMLAAVLAGGPGPAAAEEIDTALPLPPLQLHGFVSQGFLVTSANNYLADSERGSFEYAEAGLNVTMPMTDRLRAGMQLFTRDLGPIGDYQVTMDWFYLDYRWRDWLGLRAGRLKLPFGLYNDTADVDAAHSVALLPQSIYPTTSRDFLLAQTGVELYGYRDLPGAGALDYRLYGGTIFLRIEDQPGNPITVTDFSVPYLVGGRLLWETPMEGLRVGGSVQAGELDSTLLVMGNPMPVTLDLPFVLAVGSLEYARGDLLAAAEYGRWFVDVETSDPMLFPEGLTVSERGYGLLAWRLRPWVQPGAYYSILFPDVDDRDGRDAKQHDAAATVRFDVNPYWLVKLEAHYLRGTAALSPQLNDGRSQRELARDWALFLVKTTAYF